MKLQVAEFGYEISSLNDIKGDQVVRKSDMIMLVVTFGTIGWAVAFPESCRVFETYPLYLMMLFLFFSFLKIEFSKIHDKVKQTAARVLVLCLFKLILLPVGVFLLASAAWPRYAVPALLLSGMSTGVVAPFMAGLLNASPLPVLMTVVFSSLLVPFTLPALIKLLVGRSAELSLQSMVRFLAMVIFIPAAANFFLRYTMPALTKKLEEIQFPVSIAIFGLVNLGVFPRYAPFFRESPWALLEMLLVAFLLSILYHLAGFLAMWGLERKDRMAGAVSFFSMNSVLVIVFSAQFFDPLSPMLAVVYMVPLFLMIFPARVVGDRIFGQ